MRVQFVICSALVSLATLLHGCLPKESGSGGVAAAPDDGVRDPDLGGWTPDIMRTGNAGEGSSVSIELSDAEYDLIRSAYGDMSEEEWAVLLVELAMFEPEELQAWLDHLARSVEQREATPSLAECGGYYGSRIGYGFFPYSTSSARNLWTTNCWFYSSQCGSDIVLSFWMGPDYRGNQSKLAAYSSSWTARQWLRYYEGGYSGEIWQGGSYFNAYACWPWQLSSLKDYGQLKQLY